MDGVDGVPVCGNLGRLYLFADHGLYFNYNIWLFLQGPKGRQGPRGEPGWQGSKVGVILTIRLQFLYMSKAQNFFFFGVMCRFIITKYVSTGNLS